MLYILTQYHLNYVVDLQGTQLNRPRKFDRFYVLISTMLDKSEDSVCIQITYQVHHSNGLLCLVYMLITQSLVTKHGC